MTLNPVIHTRFDPGTHSTTSIATLIRGLTTTLTLTLSSGTSILASADNPNPDPLLGHKHLGQRSCGKENSDEQA